MLNSMMASMHLELGKMEG